VVCVDIFGYRNLTHENEAIRKNRQKLESFLKIGTPDAESIGQHLSTYIPPGVGIAG
jgi:hypothetical protein